jgi:Uma2 family endonuclease
MATTIKRWTLEEVHSLPDDGNKYELLRGDLLVTPPPSVGHEEIAAVLAEILHAYVAAHGLGRVYHPRAVIRALESEVEPDLMVRRVQAPGGRDWADAPHPELVVEIVSGSTRRRDYGKKRQLYLDLEIPEYWIVDGEDRSVRVVRPGSDDQIVRDVLRWTPAATEALVIDLPKLFRAGGATAP